MICFSSTKIKLIIVAVFLLLLVGSSFATLVIKGNDILFCEEVVSSFYEDDSYISKGSVRLRNFLLYSPFSTGVDYIFNTKDYKVKKKVEEGVERVFATSVPEGLLINDVEEIIQNIGYKEGVVYFNLAPKVDKFEVMEHFFIVNSLLKLTASFNEVELVQFLVDGVESNLSPYLNLKKPIKARRTKGAKVAIIIDDFGNHAKGTEDMFKLDQQITAAVIPFKERSREEALIAKEKGFDVIIHLPMEPNKGKMSWLGSKPILTSLSDDEIKKRMEAAIEDLGVAIGFNNHTGSKATADRRVMRAVLEVAKEYDLIAIDSKTSGESVVEEVCKELGVRYLERDIFLDGRRDYGEVRDATLLLTGQAIKRGSAIGIGHVGPHGGDVTSRVLKELLPSLEEIGIEVVGVSKLVGY
ncbi:divergent polysaccharide deacetylase family protein [Halonatronum saccharophilum]|uniref:divergent polysaccharide deacetylase family protein n=1 Tax=Halonatronum saccharophilum TaxID=150060 RepID=UPI000481DA0F|nr:divergent polysaccharide deacetylase family protein [Halonatronum saccharophilum]